MSSFANQLSLFFLIITILSSHARESKFFNKISSANDVVPFTTQPDFLPATGNGYGLYGEKNLPSAAESKQQPQKYLPKNYNPVSYVTEPEEIDESVDSPSIPKNNNYNNLFDGEQNYHLTPEEEQAEYRNSHYNGGGGDLAVLTGGLNNFNRAGANRFEPQGMSDTRSFENGKYHYDVSSEKYNENHPYESVRNVGFNRRNQSYYRNGENGYEFNGGQNSAVGGYQNQNDFQGQEDIVNLQP